MKLDDALTLLVDAEDRIDQLTAELAEANETIRSMIAAADEMIRVLKAKLPPDEA